jgi:hypothetical protein
MLDRTAVVACAGVFAAVALAQPDGSRPAFVPRDVAPLEPHEPCVAAIALEALVAELDDGAQGPRLDPRLTRAYRRLAYCERSGRRTIATTFGGFRLAEASIHEASQAGHEAGPAAEMLLETWAASLHQAHAGDLVSAMVGMAVERLALDQLILLAPALSVDEAEQIRDQVRQLEALRAEPSAAGDVATVELPGLQGAWWTTACGSSVGPRAERIDEAFARGDIASLQAIEGEVHSGWGWEPGADCLTGVIGVMEDALEDLERLEGRHRALRAALAPGLPALDGPLGPAPHVELVSDGAIAR